MALFTASFCLGWSETGPTICPIMQVFTANMEAARWHVVFEHVTHLMRMTSHCAHLLHARITRGAVWSLTVCHKLRYRRTLRCAGLQAFTRYRHWYVLAQLTQNITTLQHHNASITLTVSVMQTQKGNSVPVAFVQCDCNLRANLAQPDSQKNSDRRRTKDEKVTSALVHNQALHHEDVWGSGCIDPRFVDLGTSWRWVVSFTPLLHYPLG
jgi:hypothetical protein